LPEKSKGKVRTCFIHSYLPNACRTWWGLLDLLHLSLVCLCVKFLFLFFCGFRYFTFFTFPFNFNCSHDNKGQFPSFSGGSIAEMICVVIKTNIKQFWSNGGWRWVFLKRVSLEALKMQYCCLNSAPQKLSPNFTVVKDNFQH